MTHAEIERILLEELGSIAPEADLTALDRRAPLRETLDIDSMDFLNLVIALHERLKVEIPEADYPKLSTMEGAVRYLAAKAPAL